MDKSSVALQLALAMIAKGEIRIKQGEPAAFTGENIAKLYNTIYNALELPDQGA